MDGTLLLLLVIGLVAVLTLWGLVSARRPDASPEPEPGDLAPSTEGMKVCPKCGMGNLWTERRCSACGNALRG